MSEPQRCCPCRRVFIACLVLYISLDYWNEALAQVTGAQHVIVIGVDDLSPDGVQRAATLYLHQLMKTGASTLHVRVATPTVSSLNLTLMIMGAGSEQYGVTTNDWEPNKFEITSTAVGSEGTFPTIFGLLWAS